MKKAVAYVRYSSDNQREESIEAQLRSIREYCEKNGIHLVRIYTDEAKSATIDNRPGFLQMINDSRLGGFDLVIVHKLDRFARNRYDSAFYRRELKKNNVRLISVTENLDDSPESIILESVLEGMAEYYSRNLAREVMKGMKETAYQCKHTGGTPPLGYDIDDNKKYIINEEEAEAVRLIFDMYSLGKSYGKIINELNKRGYKTKRGNTFGKNSLHDIVRNEKYIGVYYYNKYYTKSIDGKRSNRKLKDESEMIRIEGGIPAIVDKDVFLRCQERLNQGSAKNARYKAKENYLLSGLIKCGFCGASMVGNRRIGGRNKTPWASYECVARRKGKICSLKAIGKEFVEKIVLDELESTLFSEEGINILAKKIHEFAKGFADSSETRLRSLEKQLVEVKKQINNIVDSVAQGLTHPSFKTKMDELEQKKNYLQKAIFEEKLYQERTPSVDEIKALLLQSRGLHKKNPDDQKKSSGLMFKK